MIWEGARRRRAATAGGPEHHGLRPADGDRSGPAGAGGPSLTDAIFLIDPDGQLRVLLRSGIAPQVLADNLVSITSRPSPASRVRRRRRAGPRPGQGVRLLRFVNLALGLWLIVAPWLPAGSATGSTVDDALAGTALFALSLPHRAIRARSGGWRRLTR